MVGVPRSTGCGLCIRRRVKCDEARPQCQNCLKYGAFCPGFERNFKFVANKPYRNKRGRKPALHEQQIDFGANDDDHTDRRRSNASSTSPPTSTAVVKRPRTSTNHAAVQSPHRRRSPSSTLATKLAAATTLTLASPSSAPSTQTQLLSIVISAYSASPADAEIRQMTAFFSLIPSHLGSEAALDAAVACFTAHHIGRLKGDEGMLRAATDGLYVRALQRLQRVIGRGGEGALGSGVMCACAVLCLFELFACPTTFDAWMKHASGIARLVQARGPARFADPFDKTMLVAFRGMIVMNDFYSGRDCFLASPAWAAVTRDPWDPRIPPKMHALMEDLINALYQFPALVRDALQLRASVAAGAADIAAVVLLLNRASAIYHGLQAWHGRWTALNGLPEPVPSPSKDPMYPVIYRYSSYAVGTTYCAYFACMAILQEILSDAKYPLEFPRATAEYVDDICRSVEWNGQGAWGPYRMGFSMRVAEEVGDASVKAWIRGWLAKFAETYAAANPRIFRTEDGEAGSEKGKMPEVREARRRMAERISGIESVEERERLAALMDEVEDPGVAAQLLRNWVDEVSEVPEGLEGFEEILTGEIQVW